MPTAQVELTKLKGQDVWHFIPALLQSHPEISQIRVQTYQPAPRLSERLKGALSTAEEEQLARIDQIRKSTGVPFWDVLLCIAMREGTLNTKMATSALLHDFEEHASTFTLSASEFGSNMLEEISNKISAEEGLALCSRVILANGEIRHIPMMDFRCPPGPANADAIRQLLAKTGQTRGVLVESGHSYHLYGTGLLSTEEWRRFMAICLLLSPVTDSRYIAHRLTDGECRLKIFSTNRSKPTIVDVFLV